MESQQELELTARARAGDLGASHTLITTHLPYWKRSARAIASREADAEDLVQSAIAQLLALWRRGDGPTSNVRAYVSVIMRNASNSYLRSPRAHWESITEAPEKQVRYVPPEYAQIDIQVERQAVRRAMGTLSDEHREVLLEVTVNGRKPGELVDDLNRPAPAISNLLARAKVALRRSLLVDYLSTGDAACRINAPAIPRTVKFDFGEHDPQEQGMPHVCGCAKCKQSWRRFAAISTALAAVPVLALTQQLALSAPILTAAATLPVLEHLAYRQVTRARRMLGLRFLPERRDTPASAGGRHHDSANSVRGRTRFGRAPALVLGLAGTALIVGFFLQVHSAFAAPSALSGARNAELSRIDAPGIGLPAPAIPDEPLLQAGARGRSDGAPDPIALSLGRSAPASSLTFAENPRASVS
ncbi:sigma-70 region 2 domain protein [Leucobacter sp. 7(1)]|uniref:RNA polymerase sigma factor n=1 Tax=Leucobacter sp. 7(1) TaxID=1255613 RepID=UPI00097F4A37|nr:sigma-70 family RNA polymerase sigma factor [Leucobacter sp. 7(1)]SJN13424.1 sigma-70 region 2 domain protein [Leucobacter sp. 7(1)]